MNLDTKKIALITATDNRYIEGTAVMLYSFLENNNWFNGDIIILENELSRANKSKLSFLFKPKFEKPNRTLIERVAFLDHLWPYAKQAEATFYSLEAFRFYAYDLVFFMDSDLVIRSSLEGLFYINPSAPILAAPDKLKYRNQMRHRDSFQPVSLSDQVPNKDYYQSFNSGMFLLNMQLLSAEIYNELLKMIGPETFSTNTTRHTDQFILNKYFESSVELLAQGYNYLIDEDNTELNQDYHSILHFVERTKPWMKGMHTSVYNQVWLEYHKAVQKRLKNYEY